MHVTLNGRPRVVADGCSAAELVAELSASPRGIAVEVDGEVLAREDWHVTLSEGARIEVLKAVQGG